MINLGKLFLLSDLSIIIGGGRNVGKSSLLKYLINSLLGDTELKEVLCLDLDIGQPEFSISSCLTLTRINAPLFGPSFALRERNFPWQKGIFYGNISPCPLLKEYLEVVSALTAEYRNLKSSVPLLVNTMGFTNNIGVDIMCDVIRIIQPTHILEIDAFNIEENYPHHINSENISATHRGIITRRGKELTYNYHRIKTVSITSGIAKKIFRDVNLLGYLSGLWPKGILHFMGENCTLAKKIDWTRIAIYIPGSFVPQTRVLQSINAALVALCKIREDCLEWVGENLPLRIQNDRCWLRFNECVGWGIVQGIDPMTRQIHLLTPLTKEEIDDKVNVLALSKIELPCYFVKLFRGSK